MNSDVRVLLTRQVAATHRNPDQSAGGKPLNPKRRTRTMGSVLAKSPMCTVPKVVVGDWALAGVRHGAPLVGFARPCCATARHRTIARHFSATPGPRISRRPAFPNGHDALMGNLQHQEVVPECRVQNDILLWPRWVDVVPAKCWARPSRAHSTAGLSATRPRPVSALRVGLVITCVQVGSSGHAGASERDVRGRAKQDITRNG